MTTSDFLDKSYFLFTPSLASCQPLKSKKEEKNSRKIRKNFRLLALETNRIPQNPQKTMKRKIQDEKSGWEIPPLRLISFCFASGERKQKAFEEKGEVANRRPEIKRKCQSPSRRRHLCKKRKDCWLWQKSREILRLAVGAGCACRCLREKGKKAWRLASGLKSFNFEKSELGLMHWRRLQNCAKRQKCESLLCRWLIANPLVFLLVADFAKKSGNPFWKLPTADKETRECENASLRSPSFPKVRIPSCGCLRKEKKKVWIVAEWVVRGVPEENKS